MGDINKLRRERKRARRKQRQRNRFAAEGREIVSISFFKRIFDFFKSFCFWIYKYLIKPVLNFAFAYTISFFVINILLKFSGLVKEVNMQPKIINFDGDGVISLGIFILAFWIKQKISYAKKTGTNFFVEKKKEKKIDPSQFLQ